MSRDTPFDLEAFWARGLVFAQHEVDAEPALEGQRVWEDGDGIVITGAAEVPPPFLDGIEVERYEARAEHSVLYGDRKAQDRYLRFLEAP